MIFKKHGKTVFGVDLTAAERRAMDREIDIEIADRNRKNEREINAVVLWQLHNMLGLGHKKLKEFYFLFNDELSKLNERYEMGEEDQPWLCTYMLKQYGVDLEAWEKEYDSMKENI